MCIKDPDPGDPKRPDPDPDSQHCFFVHPYIYIYLFRIIHVDTYPLFHVHKYTYLHPYMCPYSLVYRYSLFLKLYSILDMCSFSRTRKCKPPEMSSVSLALGLGIAGI